MQPVLHNGPGQGLDDVVGAGEFHGLIIATKTKSVYTFGRPQTSDSKAHPWD
jgi:hypothetical protein